ncbi:hypothetical protein [Nocardia sp. NPDC050710]|uniref:hypothetical protein n=1 Tax=Nocardia sp. NPDC050710 TaxID=3157220 RepID=UPI0033C5D8C7
MTTDSVVTLTKTLSDGRTAVVTVTPGCTTVHVDGKAYGTHAGPHHVFYRRPGVPEDFVAAIGRVLLTAEEAAQIQAAWDEAQARWPRDLRADRAILVHRVRCAEQEWSDAHSRRMDEGDWGDPFCDDDTNEARIEKARAELAAFDREHAELVAQLAAEHAAAVERRMWD